MKKSIRPIALVSFLCFSLTSQADQAININSLIPAAPEVQAQSYLLMDYQSGKVLAQQNADDRRDPASLTKMMTSYVVAQAIKAGKITVNDQVLIGNDAWATGNPVFKGSSLMFLKPGDSVSVMTLMQGMIIDSGNDACVALADHVAGNQNSFVDLMNQYVNQLALKNTHFASVHGLDTQGQYSSARDMGLIAQALIRDVPNEYAIYKQKELTYSNIRQLNRNGLLWDSSLQVDGVKTGHTDGAGYNLVASAVEGPMRLISVVMGTPSAKARVAESKKLLTWGFRFYQTVDALKANSAFVTEPVWFGRTDKVNLGVNRNVYLTIPRGRSDDLKTSYRLTSSELHAPLTVGQVVGTVNFTLDNQTVEQRPLVVLKAVDQGSFFSRLIDHIKLLFHHWFA